MADNKTPNHKELVASLPGSSRGDKNHVGVTNYVLMPNGSGKLPGYNPSQKDSSRAPLPHLLGSGSKIPESQHSRMCNQFSSPDPSLYNPKKKTGPVKEQGSWWSDGGRQPLMTCSVYKSTPSTKLVADKSADTQVTSKAAAKEKIRIEGERKQLMGLKDRMLSTVCMDPNVRAGSSEVQYVVGIVTGINQKLGLPFYDTGNWRLPST